MMTIQNSKFKIQKPGSFCLSFCLFHFSFFIVQAQLLINPYAFAAAGSDLNTSLISYWKMDEASGTRVDSEPTGTAQDLTDNNTVTQQTGIISSAGQFTAAGSEYLSRADSADLSTGDIDFTLSAWLYLTTKTDNIVWAGKTGTGTQMEYYCIYNTASDRFQFIVSANGSAEVTVTANNFGTVATATWHFVVCWHDSVANTINISVNDGTANSTAHSTGVFESTSPFQLGRYSTFGLHWNGRIDEVGFWKKVLTAGERTELYNSGTGKTCCPF